jgi:hypothetical protein
VLLLGIKSIVVLIAGITAAVAQQVAPDSGAVPSRYVLVLDISGSMDDGGRLPATDSSVAATLAIGSIAELPCSHEVGDYNHGQILVSFVSDAFAEMPPETSGDS